MTKKTKIPSSVKLIPTIPPKKVLLSPVPSKELHLLAYNLSFILFHNVTLHNGHFHSINKTVALLAVLLVSYRPLLTVISQSSQIRSILRKILIGLVHLIFWGVTVCICPALVDQIFNSGALSFIPCFGAILLCIEKPCNILPAPPSKASSPDEIRRYADSLVANLKSRLQYVGICAISYAYIVCLIPFTFQQSSTVVKQMSCIKTQRVSAILHITAHLLIQVLPIEYIVKLSNVARLLGKWQSAVLTDSIQSLHEWKEGVEYDGESLVRWDDRAYLALTPSVTAHPTSYPQSLIHFFFAKSFRILKIITLFEGALVAGMFYQTLSLKYVTEFLPSCTLLTLHLLTILTLAADAKHLNTSAKSL